MKLIVNMLCALVLLSSDFVHASEADLVWVETGTQHQILISHLIKGIWSEPNILYSSDNSLTSVALSTDHKGRKLLVWTEQFKTRSVLMQMQQSIEFLQWSKAKLFSDYGQENFAATMVRDYAGGIWLFWSANHGKDDDIYLVRRSLQGWSEAQKVNEQNSVPDLLPQANINNRGEVFVEWLSYSVEVGEYLTLNSTYEVEKSAESEYKNVPNRQADLSIDDLPSFSFISNNASIVLHFPNNQLHQSERIHLN